MEQRNLNILSMIDVIEESAFDAELDVLISINEQYSKIAMLMEYGNDEVINEYAIMQESVVITEGNTLKEVRKEKKDAAKGVKKADDAENDDSKLIVHKQKLIDRIKGWFKNICNAIKAFFKKIFGKSDFNVSSEAPPKEIRVEAVHKGLEELKKFYIAHEQYDENGVKIVDDKSINVFTDEGTKDWRHFRQNFEYYTLGDYSSDMYELNKLSMNELGHRLVDNYNNKTVVGPITRLSAKIRSNTDLYKWCLEKMREQKVHKKQIKGEMKSRWSQKLTPEDFQNALRAFPKDPVFDANGIMTLDTGVKLGDQTIIFELHPEKEGMVINTFLTPGKGIKLPVDVKGCADVYYFMSELLANFVDAKDKTLTQVTREYDAKRSEFEAKMKKVNAKTDTTIHEFCEAINTDGETFERGKKYTEKFVNGLPEINPINEDDKELQAAFVKMTRDADTFLKTLKEYQTIISKGKSAVIIYKIYIAYLECVGENGYLANNNPTSKYTDTKRILCWIKMSGKPSL